MTLPCKNPDCGLRRRHHEDQDTPRGTQMVETDTPFTDEDPVFCSYTCALIDGWATLKNTSKEEEDIRHAQWYAKDKTRRSIEQGLKESANGEAEYLGSFAKYVDEDV